MEAPPLDRTLIFTHIYPTCSSHHTSLTHHDTSLALSSIIIDDKWPTVSSKIDPTNMSSAVKLLLGLKDVTECTSVPLHVQTTSSFLLNTSNLASANDVKCDDNGSWVNNGVRKLWLTIHLPDNDDDDDITSSPSVTVEQRGGNRPNRSYWCLTRTYYKHRSSDDFRKVISSLQGLLLTSNSTFNLIHESNK